MKIIKLLILVAISFSLVGCATIPNGTSTPETSVTVDDFLPFVRPASAAAGSLVLQLAVSSEDRVEKANIIKKISDAVALLAANKALSPEIVKAAIVSVAPDKAQWTNLATTISALYATAATRYIKGDIAKGAQVLEQICLGFGDSADPYL